MGTVSGCNIAAAFGLADFRYDLVAGYFATASFAGFFFVIGRHHSF